MPTFCRADALNQARLFEYANNFFSSAGGNAAALPQLLVVESQSRRVKA
jgi:hypothetical protein